MAACSLVSRPKAEHVARRYLIRGTQLTIISQMLANAVLGLLGYTYRGILVIRKKLILFRFRETWIWEIILRDWWLEGFASPVKKDNPPWFYHSILRDFKTQVLQMVRVVYRKCTAQKPKYSGPNSLECGSRHTAYTTTGCVSVYWSFTTRTFSNLPVFREFATGARDARRHF